MKQVKTFAQHTPTLITAAFLLVAVAYAFNSSRPFVSSEVRFADVSLSHLSIVPASCPSSPHSGIGCIAPTVATDAASGITVSSATLNARANPNGDVATGWFRYSSTNPGSCNDSFGTRVPASGGSLLGTGISDVAYSQGISGLTQNTTYYYCAIASNLSGTGFGSVASFKAAGSPTVITNTASSVTTSSARLNGNANPNSLTAIGWFRYSSTNPGSCNDSFGTRAPGGGIFLGGGSSGVTYSQDISGLTQSVPYYYCAIAVNMAGIGFGTIVSFTPGAATDTCTDIPGSQSTPPSGCQAPIPNPGSCIPSGYTWNGSQCAALPSISDFHATPLRVHKGDPSILVWTVTNPPASCSITGNNGFSTTITPANGVQGSTPTNAIGQRTVFTMTCGTASLQTTVNIIPSYIEI